MIGQYAHVGPLIFDNVQDSVGLLVLLPNPPICCFDLTGTHQYPRFLTIGGLFGGLAISAHTSIINFRYPRSLVQTQWIPFNVFVANCENTKIVPGQYRPSPNASFRRQVLSWDSDTLMVFFLCIIIVGFLSSPVHWLHHLLSPPPTVSLPHNILLRHLEYFTAHGSIFAKTWQTRLLCKSLRAVRQWHSKTQQSTLPESTYKVNFQAVSK